MLSAQLLRQVRRLHLYARRLALGRLGGAYHSAFKGAGLTFEEVREYQPGDDVRSIDWNVTARMGRPFIKRFVEERETTVLVLMDVSASLGFGSSGQSKRRAGAEIGALFALCAAVNHDRVGAVLGTTDVERYIPPAKGNRHLQRLLRDLLAYEPVQRGTDLNPLLQWVLRTQRRRAIVVLISDFLTDNYAPAFLRVAYRHDLIAVHLIDPWEQSCPPVGLAWLEDAETGQQKLVDCNDRRVRFEFEQQRNRFVDRLYRLAAQAEADVITVQTTGGHIQAVAQFLRQREQQGRRR
ncbi:MAG: DUF58 domain-containing protein [Gemmataceae bacterium]|nr:DUF58 domain-containing protein [Gemmataceae bacterium]